MENAKYTDADRKKVELEIKKQWEQWHKRLYSHERKMIEILPQCTSFFFHEKIVFYATVPIVFF
jgi:hypothetical protein